MKQSTAKRWLGVLAAAGTMVLGPQVQAQGTYPEKSVRIVLPYAPGGSTDLQARALAQRLTENLGQTFLVDNRSGANGAIAMEYVARSAPDGYTLVYALPAQYSVNPALYSKLKYDPIRDFDPVMLVARVPLVLFAHPSLPVKNVKELILLARAQPGSLVLASAGNGSAGHLFLELLRSLTGIDILHVPYKGAGPSLVDLLSGQAQLSFLAWNTAGGLARTGKLRPLGVTASKRSAALLSIPAIADTLPGYDIANWFAFAVPKGTPQAIIVKLNAEVARALADPQLRQKFAQEAIEVIGSSPEAFGEFLKSELTKWGRLVKNSGVTVN